MTITDNGWDSRAWLEGDWLHREARRAEVRPKLFAETPTGLTRTSGIRGWIWRGS